MVISFDLIEEELERCAVCLRCNQSYRFAQYTTDSQIGIRIIDHSDICPGKPISHQMISNSDMCKIAFIVIFFTLLLIAVFYLISTYWPLILNFQAKTKI